MCNPLLHGLLTFGASFALAQMGVLKSPPSFETAAAVVCVSMVSSSLSRIGDGALRIGDGLQRIGDGVVSVGASLDGVGAGVRDIGAR